MTISCYVVDAVLTAITQLHIGTGVKTGVLKHSRVYIPGSVLRGALGVVLLKATCKMGRPMVKHEECEFFADCLYADLFRDEFNKSSRLFFKYAFPLHVSCGGVYYPAPMTLYKCQNGQCEKVYDRMVPPSRCEVRGCSGSVKPFVGYLCSQCGGLKEHPIAFSRVTSTALSRDTCSAAQVKTDLKIEPAFESEELKELAKGLLFTTELIPTGSVFGLRILVHRDVGDSLDVLKSALVEGLPDEGVGGRKSSGLGKVKVDGFRVREVTTEELAERAKVIGEWIGDAKRFVVRVVSPMLLDGGLLDAKVLCESARRAYTWMFHEGKPNLPEVKDGERRVSSEIYSGWSLKTGVRKRVEIAISPGSVFEFKCESYDESLALALASLEYCSIGSYKPHGCGQVLIEKPR
jgi:CRISPR/Cas system CSM-associated protein Csm3 (group 7 of RAMP superfamily)